MKGITISSQIIEILDYLGEKLGIAIDWSSDNVLPYIQMLCEKYINFEISTSVAWIVIGVIIAIIGICLIAFDAKNKWEYVGPTVIGAIILVITILIICVQIFDIIKCNTFPELQIIEYIKNLSSNMTN